MTTMTTMKTTMACQQHQEQRRPRSQRRRGPGGPSNWLLMSLLVLCGSSDASSNRKKLMLRHSSPRHLVEKPELPSIPSSEYRAMLWQMQRVVSISRMHGVATQVWAPNGNIFILTKSACLLFSSFILTSHPCLNWDSLHQRHQHTIE